MLLRRASARQRRAEAEIKQRPRKDDTQNRSERPFDWDGEQHSWAPVGGVGAFESAKDQERVMIQELEDRIAELRDDDGNLQPLHKRLVDQMRKEISKYRLKSMRSRWDKNYEECFKHWMAGTQRTLCDPRISPIGYRHLGEQFPRATRWAEAQLEIQATIKRYLVRLYIMGPRTEKEVEHYFRYLIWPMNMALRELRRARSGKDVQVDDLAGSDSGAWDPPLSDSPIRSSGSLRGVGDGGRDAHLWPESLTWKGSAPSKKSGIPLCLSPCLNPYMRDQYLTTSVSYSDWIKRDFSRLDGEAKELWEYAALRINGRDDAMAKEVVDETPPYPGSQPTEQARLALGKDRKDVADVCAPGDGALFQPIPTAEPTDAVDAEKEPDEEPPEGIDINDNDTDSTVEEGEHHMRRQEEGEDIERVMRRVLGRPRLEDFHQPSTVESLRAEMEAIETIKQEKGLSADDVKKLDAEFARLQAKLPKQTPRQADVQAATQKAVTALTDAAAALASTVAPPSEEDVLSSPPRRRPSSPPAEEDVLSSPPAKPQPPPKTSPRRPPPAGSAPPLPPKTSDDSFKSAQGTPPQSPKQPPVPPLIIQKTPPQSTVPSPKKSPLARPESAVADQIADLQKKIEYEKDIQADIVSTDAMVAESKKRVANVERALRVLQRGAQPSAVAAVTTEAQAKKVLQAARKEASATLGMPAKPAEKVAPTLSPAVSQAAPSHVEPAPTPPPMSLQDAIRSMEMVSGDAFADAAGFDDDQKAAVKDMKETSGDVVKKIADASAVDKMEKRRSKLTDVQVTTIFGKNPFDQDVANTKATKLARAIYSTHQAGIAVAASTLAKIPASKVGKCESKRGATRHSCDAAPISGPIATTPEQTAAALTIQPEASATDDAADLVTSLTGDMPLPGDVLPIIAAAQLQLRARIAVGEIDTDAQTHITNAGTALDAASSTVRDIGVQLQRLGRDAEAATGAAAATLAKAVASIVKNAGDNSRVALVNANIRRFSERYSRELATLSALPTPVTPAQQAASVTRTVGSGVVGVGRAVVGMAAFLTAVSYFVDLNNVRNASYGSLITSVGIQSMLTYLGAGSMGGAVHTANNLASIAGTDAYTSLKSKWHELFVDSSYGFGEHEETVSLATALSTEEKLRLLKRAEEEDDDE